MYTKRKRNFTVTITPSDREIMRRRHPVAPLAELDRFAVARAAGREAFLTAKSIPSALDSLTSAIPQAALLDWMKGRLKQAA
jgi:hypothetical protein